MREHRVEVVIEDLFEQLAKGEVKVCVARLVFGVPVGFVASAALRDTSTKIVLPLKCVVEAIDPGQLAARTAHPQRRYNIDNLPSLFTPAEAERSDPPRAVPSPVASPAEALPTAETAEAPPPAVCPVMPEKPSVIYESLDRLNGVDINRASKAELMTLDGVTPLVAEQIIAERERQGGFRSILDLAKVPRIGRKTFRRITGMPVSRTGRHRQEKLLGMLDLLGRDTVSLPDVVRAVADRPGLAGCLISDVEGLLLAEQGVGDRAQALSAIVPRLLRDIRQSLAVTGWQTLRSTSMLIDGQMLTVVDSGGIYLTVAQKSSPALGRAAALCTARRGGSWIGYSATGGT